MQHLKWRKVPEKLALGVRYRGPAPRGPCEQRNKIHLIQFGNASCAGVSRSGKAGGSKDYALVELECDGGTEIADETRNGDLGGERTLKDDPMPPGEAHELIPKGRKRRVMKLNYPVVTQINTKHTAQQKRKTTKRLLTKEWMKQKKLPAKGMDGDFPHQREDCNECDRAAKQANQEQGHHTSRYTFSSGTSEVYNDSEGD
ncbi:MKI67 FHA domain-interacting nucleolar phosphoprotein-like [Ambystoma mexicanum]|uniref:MKI67 FHA domain-interacting nucleolar phosphoprotein-like n=1 Tax=Ambystoma mexicanum TaxID=8296 RepID=UPI0037E98E11